MFFERYRLGALFMTAWLASIAAAQPPEPGLQWIEAFAGRLHTAWRNGNPMPQLSAAHPEATLDDAYRIQHGFVSRMIEGDGIGGFKAAGVGSDDPENPTVGVVPKSGVLNAADDVTVHLADDPTRHVETEIGYIFNRPVTERLPDVETLKSHVGHIAPIVEVPGNPVERAQDSTRADLVAWNINAKEIIVGDRHDPENVDPDGVAITLTRDGEVVNEAHGNEAARGQWETLRVAVNRVIDQGYTIQPGHVFTNGALGKILEAVPGRYTADFGALGTIEFTVE